MTQSFTLPYDGATPAQLNNENVKHFLQHHDHLRNELRMMLHLIDELVEERNGETAELSPSVLQGLMRAGGRYAQHLHAHHHGETQLLFPVLKREGLAPEIVERLNQEHNELGRLIDRVTASLFRTKSANISRIMNDLRQLGDALREHLDYEEKHVCPLLTRWSSPMMFYAEFFKGPR